MPQTLLHPRLRALLAFLLGILFCIVVLELFLRLFALRPHATAAPLEGNFRILCLGASHTEGMGVDPEFAYCRQLERELRAAGKVGVRTYNLGRAGWNSHQIKTYLPKYIEEYRPQLVVAMIGEPNSVNFNGLREYVADHERSEWWLGTKKYFLNLRSARLLNSLLGEFSQSKNAKLETSFRVMSDSLDGKSSQPLQERINVLEHIFELSDGKGPRAVTAATLLFHALREQHKTYHLAIPWLTRAFEASGGRYNKNLAEAVEEALGNAKEEQVALRSLSRRVNDALEKERLPPLALSLLGQIRHGKYSACLADRNCKVLLPRLVELDVESNAFVQNSALALVDRGEFDLAIRIMEPWMLWNPLASQESPVGLYKVILREMTARKASPENFERLGAISDKIIAELPWMRLRLEGSQNDRLIERWVESDLREIASFLKEQNTKFILQTMPPLRSHSLPRRDADRPILTVCGKYEVPCSDTWAAFEEFRRKPLSEDIAEIFSNRFGHTDNHLNEAGHAILTKRLISDLYRHGLL